ncbi:MAG: hypothetical protein WAK57_03530 [Desulfobacterales bacterium]
MKTQNAVERVVERIIRVLTEGVDLGSEAWHFIESTFPDTSASDLADLMVAGEDVEAAPLIELLFFPDERLQTRLEGLLSCLVLEAGAETAVADRLQAQKPVARIACPGWGPQACRFPMPAQAVPAFVARLNIGHRLAEPIAGAIERRVVEAHRDHLRVKLRNARIPFSAAQAAFICELLAKLPAGDPDLLDVMDFVLALLEELGPDGDIRGGLLEKKKFYFQNLQRAEQMADLIQGRNMETLMLQGVRMPYVDKSDALFKMSLIDRICIALFDRSVYFERVCGKPEEGTFVHKNDVGHLIRLLT